VQSVEFSHFFKHLHVKDVGPLVEQRPEQRRRGGAADDSAREGRSTMPCAQQTRRCVDAAARKVPHQLLGLT
jgi:hypothetical protein